jgi:hypothetical protein
MHPGIVITRETPPVRVVERKDRHPSIISASLDRQVFTCIHYINTAPLEPIVRRWLDREGAP